jgi:hypothetical protein
MIKDEKQYKFSQELAVEFEESIVALERDEARKKNDFDGWEIMRGSLKCQLDKLKSEIAEYDRLISHDSHTPLDTLRRTPVTKEELLASTHRLYSQQDQRMIGQVQSQN